MQLLPCPAHITIMRAPNVCVGESATVHWHCYSLHQAHSKEIQTTVTLIQIWSCHLCFVVDHFLCSYNLMPCGIESPALAFAVSFFWTCCCLSISLILPFHLYCWLSLACFTVTGRCFPSNMTKQADILWAKLDRVNAWRTTVEERGGDNHHGGMITWRKPGLTNRLLHNVSKSGRHIPHNLNSALTTS